MNDWKATAKAKYLELRRRRQAASEQVQALQRDINEAARDVDRLRAELDQYAGRTGSGSDEATKYLAECEARLETASGVLKSLIAERDACSESLRNEIRLGFDAQQAMLRLGLIDPREAV